MYTGQLTHPNPFEIKSSVGASSLESRSGLVHPEKRCLSQVPIQCRNRKSFECNLRKEQIYDHGLIYFYNDEWLCCTTPEPVPKKLT